MFTVILLHHTALLRSGQLTSVIQHESSKMHHEVLNQQPRRPMKVFELLNWPSQKHHSTKSIVITWRGRKIARDGY